MKTYIALFRGINVGGRNTLPMKALAAILERLGCRDARTYIQSGNAVFRSPERGAARLAARIAAEIKQGHGFEPAVQLLGLGEIERIMASNPFPDAGAAPNSLHVYFLESAPDSPDLGALEKIRAANERFAIAGKAFYLHAPDGIGRSKLAANAEKLLGVSATSRNWRTVCQILEMARALD